jgi:chromosome partitioning protein
VKHPQDEFVEEAELPVNQEFNQESSTGSLTAASGAGESFSAEEGQVSDDEVGSATRDSFVDDADTDVVDVIEDSAGTESAVPDEAEPAEVEDAEVEDAEPSEASAAGSAVPDEDVADPESAEPSATVDAEPVLVAAETSSSSFDDTPLARELSEITRRRRALAAEELPLPPKTRVFTVANQKGGVGKTTTTVNLAAALARNGARVLVIDLDPQGNSSTALGIEHRSETVSVYDVIINDVEMNEVVQKSPEFDALYCIPATIHLAGAEIELVSLVAREQRLRTALDRFLEESEESFHYVFIDCPPSLGLLTINAFVAASEVLIPIQCEYYALEGLSQLLTNIQLIERHLNPHLSVSTILLTMYDARTNLANQVAQDVRDHFPDQVLDTLIPRSVRISEAPSYGQSVISYDSSSPGSLSYLEAAAEIARRGAPN